MVHQSVRVYARIRKDSFENPERYEIIKQEKKEYEDIIFSSSFHVSSLHHGFRFQKVFDSHSTQSEVFEAVAKPVICSVIEGFNGTIFAYGQTGSGKTFSINGSSPDFTKRGIIPRSIQYIFDHYNNIPEKPTIYISYMEIYNEAGYDLLSTKQKVAKTLEELPRVFVMEDKKGRSHIRNLSVYPVTTEAEAMRLLFMGDTNRTIAETPYNECSSRSHCIFTLYITYRTSDSKNLRSSKLYLVDLAGSERVFKNNSTGVILNEAKFINLSLHFLQQVILALSESKRAHIPYRNSMLTHLLKDTLNGNCITTMLATLSMNKKNFQETVSTCRFAQKVSLVTTDAIINEITDPHQEISMLRKRIQELEEESSRSTNFSNSTSLSIRQKESCEFQVNSFINSEKKTIDIESDMTQIQFCFGLLKKELDKKKNELKNLDCWVSKKQTEINNLNIDVLKKNVEIEKLKNLIDTIPENPIALNTQEQKPLENMSKSEISEDLNFYKTSLQKKLNLAKQNVETIEECKRKIITIRNKLDNENLNAREKQDLIKELEEQQKQYKKMLIEMNQLQYETNHLEAGLKQAEIRYVNKQTWLEYNNLSNDVSNHPEEKSDFILDPVEEISSELVNHESTLCCCETHLGDTEQYNNSDNSVDFKYQKIMNRTVNEKSQSVEKLYFNDDSRLATPKLTIENKLIEIDNMSARTTGVQESEIDDNVENENNFADYFVDSDTPDFKEFMKTVSMSGVLEIDEEIVHFYRSKLC